jgi:hypothetical protein
MGRNGTSGNDVTSKGKTEDDNGNDKSIITLTEAANMVKSLGSFIMNTKDILDRVEEQ